MNQCVCVCALLLHSLYVRVSVSEKHMKAQKKKKERMFRDTRRMRKRILRGDVKKGKIELLLVRCFSRVICERKRERERERESSI